MSGHGIDCRLEKIADDSLVESNEWGTGRAGMQYRDLIPARLGGRLIASHIRILNGGPVPDYVHHHHVEFQMIYCYKGWVKVVYEDQGPPFVMQAGDCVLQPPHIRHRVLECSDNMEVIEVSSPAEHETLVDHELELPTKTIDHDRNFDGQRFVHHEKVRAKWLPGPYEGFEAQATDISNATAGLASAQIIRPSHPIQTVLIEKTDDFSFMFTLQGSATLRRQSEMDQPLAQGDAFVVPASISSNLTDISGDFELLLVVLRGSFA